ncbi:Propionate catabolism operon regulatory protein PrpR [Lachnospiraceae bacterium TWA4]|nr:Propionate catabolism operon regulatory protein PrpR [Lachnospiraceae bacterium TWA4]
MTKIRLLGIVPYESLGTLMKQIIKTYEMIDLDVYIGNLEQAIEVANQYAKKNYDAIISRGETAKLLKNHSTIPVFEIPISSYDLLQPLQMALVASKRIAIVGYSSLTGPAYNVKNLLSLIPNSILEIITITNTTDIHMELEQLKTKTLT